MPSARELGGHGFGPLVGVGEESFVVAFDGDSGDGGGRHGHSSLRSDNCLPAVGMCRGEPGEVAAGEQGVPVHGLEQQLAEVVEPRLLQERQANLRGVVAGQRLGVVVEVDQQRLVEPGLDEAVGVAVEPRLERFAGQEPAHVADEGLALEVGDRTGLGGGNVGGVADDEDVRRGLRLQGVLVGGDEVELVAEAR